MNNFELHGTEGFGGGNDVGSFIESTWKDVPPRLALEAINKVLEAAKQGDSQSHYTMSSAKGSVALNSDYALRLFQLLPVLEELDSDKAEALLREQTEAAEQLKTQQSLKSDNSSLSYGGVSVSDSEIRDIAAQQQIEAQMRQRVKEILKKADMDPSGALASALALPVNGTSEFSSPRSDALLGIAEKTVAQKGSVSKSALDELSTIADQLSPQEMIGLETLPELYLKIGEVDGARKAVDILVKAAGKAYEKDTEADDPNKSFKGTWPSTVLWGKAIKDAAKIRRSHLGCPNRLSPVCRMEKLPHSRELRSPALCLAYRV